MRDIGLSVVCPQTVKCDVASLCDVPPIIPQAMLPVSLTLPEKAEITITLTQSSGDMAVASTSKGTGEAEPSSASVLDDSSPEKNVTQHDSDTALNDAPDDVTSDIWLLPANADDDSYCYQPLSTKTDVGPDTPPADPSCLEPDSSNRANVMAPSNSDNSPKIEFGNKSPHIPGIVTSSINATDSQNVYSGLQRTTAVTKVPVESEMLLSPKRLHKHPKPTTQEPTFYTDISSMHSSAESAAFYTDISNAPIIDLHPDVIDNVLILDAEESFADSNMVEIPFIGFGKSLKPLENVDNDQKPTVKRSSRHMESLLGLNEPGLGSRVLQPDFDVAKNTPSTTGSSVHDRLGSKDVSDRSKDVYLRLGPKVLDPCEDVRHITIESSKILVSLEKKPTSKEQETEAKPSGIDDRRYSKTDRRAKVSSQIKPLLRAPSPPPASCQTERSLFYGPVEPTPPTTTKTNTVKEVKSTDQGSSSGNQDSRNLRNTRRVSSNSEVSMKDEKAVAKSDSSAKDKKVRDKSRSVSGEQALRNNKSCLVIGDQALRDNKSHSVSGDRALRYSRRNSEKRRQEDERGDYKRSQAGNDGRGNSRRGHRESEVAGHLGREVT